MEEYIFKSTWKRIESTPTSGTRCLVTDGDTIVLGTYAEPYWVYTGLDESNVFNPIGWMEIPKLMKKTVVYDSTKEC